MICLSDILSLEEYELQRPLRQEQIFALKKERRLFMDPWLVLVFENKDTILYQIQEMLRAEKGGISQIHEEIEAYGPLVPTSTTLSATLMIEIPDSSHRHQVLADLTGIEEELFLVINNQKIKAKSHYADIDKMGVVAKTSAVHFLTFFFTSEQKKIFCDSTSKALLEISHPHYSAQIFIPDLLKESLIIDLMANKDKTARP